MTPVIQSQRRIVRNLVRMPNSRQMWEQVSSLEFNKMETYRLTAMVSTVRAATSW
jgi:hypothetical protein